MNWALLLFVLSFLVLLLGGMPVAWAMICATILWMIASNELVFLLIMPDKIFQGIDVFILMAVPLFILVGELLNTGRITDRLINFANQFFGWISGGLAQVNIGSSILFSGITGVALGDIAALGRVFIPAMVKQGYSPAYAAAVTASSSIVGPMVPPSLIIVIYGAATGVSIGALFAACVLPGLLVGICQMGLVWHQAKKGDIKIVEADRSMQALMSSSAEAIIPLMVPIIILVGILGGVMTPTEAGAVAAFYALVIALFYYRTMKIADLYGVFARTMTFSGKLLIIVGCGTVFSLVMAIENVPGILQASIQTAQISPLTTLLIANLVLLFIGMFIDPAAAIILFAPILSTVAVSAGIDPVHFGVIMILNLNLGLLTPPLGICLFAAEEIADCGLPGLIRETIPFLLTSLIVLILVTYIPAISLWLPHQFGF
ncbi:MAG: TRAP transporter large permease [Gammaproteobacteria bacterium]|jgi:tripartite ATP-independent transporter DctM subunit|nr:TRAP transporter large permease [Gammaproteobacteria bacterium]